MLRFDLVFDPPCEKPLPGPGRAYIALGYFTKKEDRILVSPECRTIREVEDAVNDLKEALDRVLAQARQKFAKSPAR